MLEQMIPHQHPEAETFRPLSQNQAHASIRLLELLHSLMVTRQVRYLFR